MHPSEGSKQPLQHEVAQTTLGDMIEQDTGRLLLEDGSAIGPLLNRDTFLNMDLASQAEVLVKNEPWCSWRVPRRRISGATFGIAVYFRAQALQMVMLAICDPPFDSTSWDDWSQEREMEAKLAHDQWLHDIIGGGTQFSWGTIWSGYDEKSAFSTICIKYSGEV
jgi:hypothetical protein